MNERYKITKISELIDLVNENNVDLLAKDLHNWLTLLAQIKMLQDKIGLPTSFDWVDDGKNEVTVYLMDSEGEVLMEKKLQ